VTVRRRPRRRRRARRPAGAGLRLPGLALLAGLLAGMAAGAQVVPYEVVEDGIPAPLDGRVGDAVRGRAIAVDRQKGLCMLCHSGPFPELRFMGTLAPDLAGAGQRWTQAQLRLRLVDSWRLDPGSIMPAYHRVDGLTRVAAPFAGRPILDAGEIEDLVAYLATLR
jgi:sulfur-oxidizing protein SoxX